MNDTVQDFVKKKIYMVNSNDDVLTIFNSMKKNKVHHIPVVEDGRAVGIISDRDLQFVSATDQPAFLVPITM